MRASLAFLAAMLLPHLPLAAQDQNSTGVFPTYKVTFTITDSADAAAQNSRRYTLRTETGHKAILKVGDRVPVVMGGVTGGSPSSGSMVNTQYTYVDVGVNIECTLSDQNGSLRLHGDIDLSSIMKHPAALNASNPPNPGIGQTKLAIDAAVFMGKPAVIVSIDDPDTPRHFQVEALVSRAD
jgi:hypothetical protein